MFDSLAFFGFVFLAVVLLSVIFFFIRFQGNRSARKRNTEGLRTQKNESGGIEFIRCPLCNTPLAKNENMVSRVFRPMDVSDQRMTVLGCPHCYPKCEPDVERICPVCRANVPMDGYLIARLFNKTAGKKHVMITGCTICYGPKKR